MLGQLAVLAAAFSYACAGVYGRRFKGISPQVAAAGMLTSTACTLSPFALIAERPQLSFGGGLALLGLGVLSTALAYLIYFHLLARAGATNLLLVTFLIPVSALLLGSLFLGEQIGYSDLLGMGLISLGLAAIDGRLLKRR
jgi:drug/metabolite transporter (DMT)-like permease